MFRHRLAWFWVAAAACALAAAPGHADGAVSRAYINSDCIIADEPFLLPEDGGDVNARMAPLLGAVAAKLTNTLVSGALTGLTGGLKRRSARKDTTYVTANNVNLFVTDLSGEPQVRLNPQFGCATIVTGDIRPSDYDCTAEYVPRTVSSETMGLPTSEWVTTREDNSVENILKRANVCLADEVDSVFEARIVLSADRTAYRVDSAGYTFNSLLSTRRRSAKRNTFYTMEVFEPDAGEEGEPIAVALLNLGEISAGDSSLGDAALSTDWMEVPKISNRALQDFLKATAVHREVYGKIAALDRVVSRDRRLLAGIEQRANATSEDIRAALQGEMKEIEIRLIRSDAMLDALRGEYADLPVVAEEYMPVTIQFGITESRSERNSLKRIAEIIEKNRDKIAASAAKLAGVERSFGAVDSDPLATARDDYYDALIALDLADADDASVRAQLDAELERTKRAYNDALIAEGLNPVE